MEQNTRKRFTLKPLTFRVTQGSLEIPRMGDVIDGIIIKGSKAHSLTIRLFGFPFRSFTINKCAECHIPVTINLLRLGLHSAHIDLVADDVADITINYRLYEHIEDRRQLCSKAPNTAMPIDWYSIIDMTS